jgi:hypothetical protein
MQILERRLQKTPRLLDGADLAIEQELRDQRRTPELPGQAFDRWPVVRQKVPGFLDVLHVTVP